MKTLLYHMVPILMRQNIKFKFFTITQNQNVIFNRAKERFSDQLRAPWIDVGHLSDWPSASTEAWSKEGHEVSNKLSYKGENFWKLLNIGFQEASQLNEFDCFIFHDVDLLIENDNAIYHCDRTPLHYSGMFSSVDQSELLTNQSCWPIRAADQSELLTNQSLWYRWLKSVANTKKAISIHSIINSCMVLYSEEVFSLHKSSHDVVITVFILA